MVTHILPVLWRVYLNTSLLGSTHNLHVLQDPGDITEKYALLMPPPLLCSHHWIPSPPTYLYPVSSLKTRETKLNSRLNMKFAEHTYQAALKLSIHLIPWAILIPCSAIPSFFYLRPSDLGNQQIRSCQLYQGSSFPLVLPIHPQHHHAIPPFLKQTLSINFQPQKVIFSLPPPYTSCEALAGLELAM